MKNKLVLAAEAIFFSCADAVSLSELAASLGVSKNAALDIALELQKDYDDEKRGVKLIRLEDAFQMCSREDYFGFIRDVTEPRQKQALSPAALETLSVIAYNQPATRARVEFIRGVDCTGSIGRLLERGLIDEVGRMDTPGKPILYGTTDEFLRCFGLSALSELPKIDDEPKQENFLEKSGE